MGLMRRVESRVERSVGAVPPESAPDESRRARPKRDAKFFVKPGELARKLVKEMEDHKISHADQETVRSEYTVFLCPDDYSNLHDRLDDISDKLQRHLAKHVRSKRYTVHGDITVDIIPDDSLPFGKFGIMAERFQPARPAYAGPASMPLSPQAPAAAAERAPARTPAQPVPQPPASQATMVTGGGTAVIPSSEASQLGLAHKVIVLKAGNRVREFSKGRIVLGRARDADFRVDDPNVSRRHAAIYWDEGRIFVQDLGSTNGTMVNGYPVTTTVLRPTDVLVVGDCRITVESK